MKVLSIGTDRKLFEEGSNVVARSLQYAARMEELHIIVFTKKGQFKDTKIGNNLFLYPTNSRSRWTYISDAVRIGRGLLSTWDKTKTVVSVQDPFETGLVGKELSQAFGVPLQVQVHTDFLSPYFKKSFLNRVRVFISKRIIPYARGIRTVSEVISDSIRKQFPHLTASLSVLPIRVDVETLFTATAEKNIRDVYSDFKFIVFMASRLEQEKRVDVALQVMKEVVSVFPQAGLIIAGDGKERGNLERKARSLGIWKNVAFVGWQNDLISYYKAADAFLLTSEYEGYGMTLIEAGASGCPVVTTSVGLAKTSLFIDGENSFVCPVGDVRCLADSVLKLVHSNPTSELFKQKMQASIRGIEVSSEEYSRQYVALLESLL